MFTIVISEKGGAERRESFDNGEINVGRVQGNDLMLPKGNVSKQHARLLFRDGRFIVTDLKSTNGTYVNGRKISQATIVREGDKIYIGDFVLRLETGQQAAGQADAPRGVPPEDDALPPSSVRSPPRIPTPPPMAPPAPSPVAPPPLVAAGASLAPTPPPLPAQSIVTSPSALPVGLPVVGPAALSPPALTPLPSVAPRGGEASTSGASADRATLDREVEDGESAPGGAAARGGPPALPVAARRPATLVDARPRPGPIPLNRAQATGQRSAAPVAAAAGPTRSAPQIIVPPVGKALPRESSQQAARRLALVTLIDRVGDAMDLAPLGRSTSVDAELARQIEQTVRDQAKAMHEEGEAPEGVDRDLLARDAVRELVGLGPLGQLLEDEEVSEVHVGRPDYVVAQKKGQAVLAEPPFSSEDAVARVVARLAAQSGEPLREGEVVIERRLPRGALLVAVAPPAAAGWVVTVRKRRRVEVSLDDLVRGASMSKAIATFLDACVAGRANVIVAGSGAAMVSPIVAALAAAAPAGERIAVLQDAEEIAAPQAQTIALTWVSDGARGEESVRAAVRLGIDRLVVASIAGSTVAAVVDAIGEGTEGVIAGVSAPSLRPGLARLATAIAVARPGATIEAAREAIGESFDIAVEVSRGAEGRARVSRVVELAGGDAKGIVARDLFTLSGDGLTEPTYVATGTTPRVASDLAARGIKLDPALFKRASR